MEYRNETEKKVLGQLVGGHVWENIQKNGKALKIELVKCSEQSYAIFNAGIHTGAFIAAFFINLDEAKALGWKVKGKIENAIDPDEIQPEVKKRRRRKVQKEDKKK